MARSDDPPNGYRATPELERELKERGTATLSGGRYNATVATASMTYFEAWTDSQPFVYGRPSRTLQGALDALEDAVREAEARLGSEASHRRTND